MIVDGATDEYSTSTKILDIETDRVSLLGRSAMILLLPHSGGSQIHLLSIIAMKACHSTGFMLLSNPIFRPVMIYDRMMTAFVDHSPLLCLLRLYRDDDFVSHIHIDFPDKSHINLALPDANE